MSSVIYNRASFGGTDITAVFAGKIIGELQAISFSVTREKGPIYTMGSADPRGFARNKRGIAGSLVFITFDKDAFMNHMYNAGTAASNFWAHKNDEKTLFSSGSAFDSSLQDVTSPINTLSNAGDERMADRAWYADQILPFDVNLSAANEYGGIMKKSIIDVEILNEGSGVSIDDLVLEQQMTFVCRGMTQWVNVSRNGQSATGIANSSVNT